MESAIKKARHELFDLPSSDIAINNEESQKLYRESIKAHPFQDNAHSIADIYENCVFRDGKDNVIGVLVKRGLPEYAAKMAANVLRSAATKTSLRSNIYGGSSPNSGIAGYFDYRGSPIEFKCRKTVFTYENECRWKDVFPMVDYISQIYKHIMPDQWAKQDAAIPDITRIHNSPFSTLTINSRFRTASHRDTGDFDEGYGCLACLEGNFKGLALTLGEFKVNFVLRPLDVLLFNTHLLHSNTESELMDDNWTRLTCVFYYRTSLGEPASYAEYQRRLQAALNSKCSKPPVVRSIVVKSNGSTTCKPSILNPLCLTPFWFTTVLHCLSHARDKGFSVHQWLLKAGSFAEELLFGEPLCVLDGIPERSDDDFERVQSSDSFFKVPETGGFKESNFTMQAAALNQKYLERTQLSELLNPELLDIWLKSRNHWLELVKEIWLKLKARNPERTDFFWNNRSEMNAAFFDLCDVAKQVMLSLLDKDSATPMEEQVFWASYAAHLSSACRDELQMPEDAMSLKKLNVKLKDFQFGGARYFKNMPIEEQMRRLKRREELEAARRNKGVSTKCRNWLLNDSFDYQTEDESVDYDNLNQISPELNAKRVTQVLDMSLKTSDNRNIVEILVVLPAPRIYYENGNHSVDHKFHENSEWSRLLANPAAQRLMKLSGKAKNVLPEAILNDKLHIIYAFQGNEPAQSFDFIVLQHVLTTMNDKVAKEYVASVVQKTKGCLLLEETDAFCRRHYVLKREIRERYQSVAMDCFQRLHYIKYGVYKAIIRTNPGIQELFHDVAVRYKIQGSPLNTTLLMIPGGQ
ncbi:unnamed protein product [Phytomonas sp. Hart1]|nr:unnamed protein product [Phytomonas sp. Hart1]|eukprot:CCW66736.1 unnamed protein product [Phytomonas sp. isolate Hart1]